MIAAIIVIIVMKGLLNPPRTFSFLGINIWGKGHRAPVI
jgi:hypothetical protein